TKRSDFMRYLQSIYGYIDINMTSEKMNSKILVGKLDNGTYFCINILEHLVLKHFVNVNIFYSKSWKYIWENIVGPNDRYTILKDQGYSKILGKLFKEFNVGYTIGSNALEKILEEMGYHFF